MLSCASTAAQKTPMTPGKWEVTLRMTMADVEMKPATIMFCVTTEDAKRPAPPDVRGDDCIITSHKVRGNTATWTTRCERAKLVSKGKMIFAGDTYIADAVVTMNGVDMRHKYTGRYVGPCD